MSKLTFDREARPLYSFYRPHKRVLTMNHVVNHVTGEVTSPPSRTKQQFADECDINNILKQFKQTGIIRHINEKAAKGAYLDLPPPIDFQDALNVVIKAEESFDTLPSKVRAKFNNDPQEFLEFMADPQNVKEAIQLGLVTAEQRGLPDQGAKPPGEASGAKPAPPSPSPAPDA